MKYLILVILTLCLVSCNENKTVTNQYRNGNVESVHYYGADKKIDSSHFFAENQKNNQIVYYRENDSINVAVEFDEEGNKFAEGKIVKKNIDFRIGQWKFFNRPNADSIVEYFNVDNKSYTNQIWILDKNSKDTLYDRGNFYYIFNKDTISINDTLKYRFYLYQPFYSYNSEMEVIIPEDSKKLKEDFSNFHEIEKDTFYSLKNDGIPHPEIPEEVPKNHNVNFGVIYTKPGEKRIRGYIAEYIYKINNRDSTRIERRLYFDKRINIIE